jgi:hypothetical protein
MTREDGMTTTIRRSVIVPFALALLGTPLAAAPPQVPTITLHYATAETSTSAEVWWNTNIASDSLLQYSTSPSIPPGAPQVYQSAPVTVRAIELTGLTPATLYYYRVTSCTRRGCASATGSFDTFPSCPDEVPAVSGSWQNLPSPNVEGPTLLRNILLGVAALSPSDVWAVGWSQEPDAPPYVKRTLTQHFDGSAWTIVPSANPEGDTQTVLYSVSGTAAGDVWAVGSTHNGLFPSRTLIQHWNGTQWSIVPSPSPDTQLNELRAVAAVSADDVWTVGYRGGTHSETPLETLILHWNGASWTQVSSPNVPGGANELNAIVTLSASDVWAVGSAGGAPLAMRWNGSAWSVVPVNGDTGLGAERLTGISGTAADDLWAVGDGRGIFTNQTFATLRHWNGVYWTDKVCRAHSASNPPDGYEGGGPSAYFTGISAAAGSIWVVGVRGSGPTIQHWDDEAWTSVIHPRAFPNSAALYGVATSGGSAWGVGMLIKVDVSGAVSPERTLIYRYSP